MFLLLSHFVVNITETEFSVIWNVVVVNVAHLFIEVVHGKCIVASTLPRILTVNLSLPWHYQYPVSWSSFPSSSILFVWSIHVNCVCCINCHHVFNLDVPQLLLTKYVSAAGSLYQYCPISRSMCFYNFEFALLHSSCDGLIPYFRIC